jgi:hypothetical protein
MRSESITAAERLNEALILTLKGRSHVAADEVLVLAEGVSEAMAINRRKWAQAMAAMDRLMDVCEQGIGGPVLVGSAKAARTTLMNLYAPKTPSAALASSRP